MKHVAFSPKLQVRYPDGRHSCTLDPEQSNHTASISHIPQHDATKVPHTTILDSGNHGCLPLGSQLGLDAHPIHELQYDDSPCELTIPLAQQYTSDVCTLTKSRLPAPPSKESSSSTMNRVMSEFFLLSRKYKSLATVHNRANKYDFEDTDEPVVKIKACHHSSPLTPWQLGQRHLQDVDKAMEFYNWMTTLQPRPVITA